MPFLQRLVFTSEFDINAVGQSYQLLCTEIRNLQEALVHEKSNLTEVFVIFIKPVDVIQLSIANTHWGKYDTTYDMLCVTIQNTQTR